MTECTMVRWFSHGNRDVVQPCRVYYGRATVQSWFYYGNGTTVVNPR